MNVDCTSSADFNIELPVTPPQLPPSLRGKSNLMKETKSAVEKQKSNPLIITNNDDFYAQHNAHCEVCANPGHILCCLTCTAVFHLHCARPILNKYPPDNWRCAFCLAECDHVNL